MLWNVAVTKNNIVQQMCNAQFDKCLTAAFKPHIIVMDSKNEIAHSDTTDISRRLRWKTVTKGTGPRLHLKGCWPSGCPSAWGAGRSARSSPGASLSWSSHTAGSPQSPWGERHTEHTARTHRYYNPPTHPNVWSQVGGVGGGGGGGRQAWSGSRATVPPLVEFGAVENVEFYTFNFAHWIFEHWKKIKMKMICWKLHFFFKIKFSGKKNPDTLFQCVNI